MTELGLSEQTKQMFSDLLADVPEVLGVILATLDGLPMVFEMKPGISAERVAAMVATAMSVGRRVAPTIGIGDVNEISISANDGRLFLYVINQNAALAILAPKDVNLGMIIFKTADIVPRLMSLLEQTV